MQTVDYIVSPSCAALSGKLFCDWIKPKAGGAMRHSIQTLGEDHIRQDNGVDDQQQHSLSGKLFESGSVPFSSACSDAGEAACLDERP